MGNIFKWFDSELWHYINEQTCKGIKIKIITTYLVNELSWKGSDLWNENSPGIPSTCAIPSSMEMVRHSPQQMLRIKLTGCCSTTYVAPPFSSLQQSMAIGDETLIVLRTLEQWLWEEKDENWIQLNALQGKLDFLAVAIPRLRESGLQDPAELPVLKEFAF